ncbi:MAG: hypothetical protein LIV11_04140 [Bacillota bacterium]|nr:hypothetical protein [Bacillota bacterium]
MTDKVNDPPLEVIPTGDFCVGGRPEADTPAIPLLRETIRSHDIDTWLTAWLEGTLQNTKTT